MPVPTLGPWSDLNVPGQAMVVTEVAQPQDPMALLEKYRFERLGGGNSALSATF